MINVVNMKEEVRRRYHSNGQLMSDIPYVNENIHGLKKWWYDNGKLECEIPYINGKVRGLIKWWYKNGNLDDEFPHKNKFPHGAKIQFRY